MYRLYDPTSRKVVVSRDVVFDENKGWKWNTSGKETHQPAMIMFPLVQTQDNDTDVANQEDDINNDGRDERDEVAPRNTEIQGEIEEHTVLR